MLIFPHTTTPPALTVDLRRIGFMDSCFWYHQTRLKKRLDLLSFGERLSSAASDFCPGLKEVAQMWSFAAIVHL